MATVTRNDIASLFQPETAIPGLAEKAIKGSTLLTSPAVVRDATFDAALNGGSVAIKVPFFQSFRKTDQIQVEDTAPDVGKVTQAIQIAPRLQRVVGAGKSSLARAYTMKGSDPLDYILTQLADNRNYNRQVLLLAMLDGLFATAFSALKVSNFSETLNTTSTNFIDSAMITNAIALLGEASARIATGGVIWMHPDIQAALRNQDANDFVVQSSGAVTLSTWRGLTIYLSEDLKRAGTTSGYVYTTYLLAPGVIAVGDMPQTNTPGDSASLLVESLASTNSVDIYDRTDFFVHVNGAKWVGTAAGTTPTNAELATAGNWNSAFANVKSVGVVSIKTNG
jgi:hypothetical protein